MLADSSMCAMCSRLHCQLHSSTKRMHTHDDYMHHDVSRLIIVYFQVGLRLQYSCRQELQVEEGTTDHGDSILRAYRKN